MKMHPMPKPYDHQTLSDLQFRSSFGSELLHYEVTMIPSLMQI